MIYMALWDTFDTEFDLGGIKEDIKTAKEEGSGAQREEVPTGSYEVKVEKLELVTTKKAPARPMVTAWLKIVEGEFKNNMIFMNQLVDEGWKINQANEFINKLTDDVEVTFDSFSQYADMLLDIHEDIDGKYEYAIDYGKTKNNYPTYTITDRFDVSQ